MSGTVINAHFNGTGHYTTAEHLTNLLHGYIDGQRSYLFGGSAVTAEVDGCFTGLRGSLFGHTLSEQSHVIADRVKEYLDNNKLKPVTLNISGHSRGGIAALLLAKQLRAYPKDRLKINLFLHDPVPGNFVLMGHLDVFSLGLSQHARNLSNCPNINDVEIIHPVEPLIFLAAHAPLIPTFHSDTNVNIITTPGCHASAQGDGLLFCLFNYGASLANHYAFKFFEKHGSCFHDTAKHYMKNSDADVASLYEDAMKKKPLKIHYRSAHSSAGLDIVGRPGRSIKYFNAEHARLSGEQIINEQDLRYSIKRGHNPVALAKKHPKIAKCLLWLLIGAGIAGAIAGTYGLAAIPIIGMGIAKLTTIPAIIEISPLFALLSSAVWYGFLKPLVKWVTNKTLYRHAQVLSTKPKPKNATPILNRWQDERTRYKETIPVEEQRSMAA